MNAEFLELLAERIPPSTLQLLARLAAEAEAGTLSDAQIDAFYAQLREVPHAQAHPIVRGALPVEHQLGRRWRSACFAADEDAVWAFSLLITVPSNRREIVETYICALGGLLLTAKRTDRTLH